MGIMPIVWCQFASRERRVSSRRRRRILALTKIQAAWVISRRRDRSRVFDGSAREIDSVRSSQWKCGCHLRATRDTEKHEAKSSRVAGCRRVTPEAGGFPPLWLANVDPPGVRGDSRAAGDAASAEDPDRCRPAVLSGAGVSSTFRTPRSVSRTGSAEIPASVIRDGAAGRPMALRRGRQNGVGKKIQLFNGLFPRMETAVMKSAG